MVTMFKAVGFHLFSSFGNLFIHYWKAFAFVYFLFVKDCLKILMWTSIKLKRRFFWIMRELYVDNLWQVVLEEAQNEYSDPLFPEWSVIENSSSTHNQLIRKNSTPIVRKIPEIYMCPSYRSRNKSFLHFKNFDLKSHTKKGTSSSACDNLSHNIGPPCALNPLNINTESSEYQNTAFSTGILGSMEYKNARNASPKSQNVLRYTNKQNSLKNRNVIARSPEYQNSCFVNDQKSENITPQSFNFRTTACADRTQKIAEETIPKKDEIATPLKRRTHVSNPLATPVCEIQFNPKKSRIELEFSDETHIPNLSPEEESFVKRSWNKWKKSCRFDKTCDLMKSNPKENSVISNDYPHLPYHHLPYRS